MQQTLIVTPIIIEADELIHTDEHPFCDDMTCPCHEDPELLHLVNEQVVHGLLTAEEATRFIMGCTL